MVKAAQLSYCNGGLLSRTQFFLTRIWWWRYTRTVITECEQVSHPAGWICGDDIVRWGNSRSFDASYSCKEVPWATCQRAWYQLRCCLHTQGRWFWGLLRLKAGWALLTIFIHLSGLSLPLIMHSYKLHNSCYVFMLISLSSCLRDSVAQQDGISLSV